MADKPDAMTLWTHLGSLAEVMRARRTELRMTPAALCAADMDTCLLDEDTTVAIDGKARVYRAGKREYARMWIARGTLVLQFKAPKDKSDLDMQYFKKLPKAGWLEYRRPATRDPRPDLVANLGTVLGRAAFERKR